MDKASVRKKIVESVSVSSQMVTYAKSFFLKNFQSDTKSMIAELLVDVEVIVPDKIVIHPTAYDENNVVMVAKAISWKLASYEAIWGMVGNGLILIASGNNYSDTLHIGWTTVIPGSGGESSRWNFDEFNIILPIKTTIRPSGILSQDQPISDPNLYLHELNIEVIDADIELSLREAVECFKHELFLGCLALLGRASEGTWIELGKALANVVSKKSRKDGDKLQSSMDDNFIGIGKKISTVLRSYELKDIFQEIYRSSGYKPVELKSCVVWSDAVRESRNSIHYGAKPAMTNSYEKVAALLIGAVPNLKVMYGIIEKCT